MAPRAPKLCTGRRRLARERVVPLVAALGVVVATALVGCGGGVEGTGVPGEVAFDLHEANDANIAGARAVLKFVDENSTLVTVDGLDASEQPGRGSNPVRIVEGSCEHPGDIAFALSALSGSGSETRLDVGIDEFYTGDYALQVLFSKERAEPLACGDVPDEPPA
jgi:hypothetical protein